MGVSAGSTLLSLSLRVAVVSACPIGSPTTVCISTDAEASTEVASVIATTGRLLGPLARCDHGGLSYHVPMRDNTADCKATLRDMAVVGVR